MNILVWSGVWVASPGPPASGDRWDESQLLETKNGWAYVSGPGGVLWVAPGRWKKLHRSRRMEDLHGKSVNRP